MRSLYRLLPFLLLPLLVACDGKGAPAAAKKRGDALLAPVAKIAAPDIEECSGIVRHGGAWWTLCDSGAQPVLWRSETPDFAGVERLAVDGAVNVDWEELTTFGDDLLIADLGDNLRRRDDLMLYRVHYTAGKGNDPGRLSLVAKYPVAWPDGPHDCEATFVRGETLYAVTKDRGEGTHVFQFSPLKSAQELSAGARNTPKVIGTLKLGVEEQVTGAAYDAESKSVILLTYTQLARYPEDALSGHPATSTWIGARQSEAVAVDGEDLVFTNEQRDVFRVSKFREWHDLRLLPTRATSTLSAEMTDISLQDAADGEWAKWALEPAGIHVTARIKVDGELTASEPDKGRPGSGIVLCFSEQPVRHVAEQGTQIAVTFGGDLASDVARVDRVSTSPDQRELTPVPGARATLTKTKHYMEIDVVFPETIAFGHAVPQQFLFDFYAYQTGRKDSPRHSGIDLWNLFRPYMWGDCTRK